MFLSPSSSRPRTPAFHAGNRGSNPLGDAKTLPSSPGDVAQLGERNAGSVEVRGSIPLVSTNPIDIITDFTLCFQGN